MQSHLPQQRLHLLFLFKTRELRNAFVEETKGMMKAERMEVYERNQQKEV
jgi:hypothetical protein